MDRILGIFTFKNEAYDAKCDFFMWCDEVQNFVDSQITCGKDEKVKNLENRVARLEDELRDLNSIVNKTKMVVKSLPKAFSFLNIVDADEDDESDGGKNGGGITPAGTVPEDPHCIATFSMELDLAVLCMAFNFLGADEPECTSKKMGFADNGRDVPDGECT
ncbi:hypothetical protein Taro_018828, partial [Colocasia esculenta]|nr:hypothetical protein [Colocasia esculenta]